MVPARSASQAWFSLQTNSSGTAASSPSAGYRYTFGRGLMMLRHSWFLPILSTWAAGRLTVALFIVRAWPSLERAVAEAHWGHETGPRALCALLLLDKRQKALSPPSPSFTAQATDTLSEYWYRTCMSTAAAAHSSSIFLNVLRVAPNRVLVSTYSLYILHHPAYVHVVIWRF